MSYEPTYPVPTPPGGPVGPSRIIAIVAGTVITSQPAILPLRGIDQPVVTVPVPAILRVTPADLPPSIIVRGVVQDVAVFPASKTFRVVPDPPPTFLLPIMRGIVQDVPVFLPSKTFRLTADLPLSVITKGVVQDVAVFLPSKTFLVVPDRPIILPVRGIVQDVAVFLPSKTFTVPADLKPPVFLPIQGLVQDIAVTLPSKTFRVVADIVVTLPIQIPLRGLLQDVPAFLPSHIVFIAPVIIPPPSTLLSGGPFPAFKHVIGQSDYNTKYNYTAPALGASVLCSLCGVVRPWGAFDRDTNQILCMVCCENIRHGRPISPPAQASFYAGEQPVVNQPPTRITNEEMGEILNLQFGGS